MKLFLGMQKSTSARKIGFYVEKGFKYHLCRVWYINDTRAAGNKIFNYLFCSPFDEVQNWLQSDDVRQKKNALQWWKNVNLILICIIFINLMSRYVQGQKWDWQKSGAAQGRD
jgi:hypothetical protein